MQTTPAIERATRRYCGPTQPSRTKIRQVSRSVAIVMPEIGFDDEPITPVIRELTVTKRNPKNTTMMPPMTRPVVSVGIKSDAATAATRPRLPSRTSGMGISRSVRSRCVSVPPSPSSAPRSLPAPKALKLPRIEAKISGRALSMLRMPPAATAPAPMYRTYWLEISPAESAPIVFWPGRKDVRQLLSEIGDHGREHEGREDAAANHDRGDPRTDDVADAQERRGRLERRRPPCCSP